MSGPGEPGPTGTTPRGDGSHRASERWITCAAGHRHWGAFGAAGMLISTSGSDGDLHLVVRRALWVHEGGTWSIPGGARHADETAEAAAARETVEEIGPLPEFSVLSVGTEDCGGGWTFTTVRAAVAAPFSGRLSAEVDDVRWLAVREFAGLALHPGFRDYLERHQLL